LSCAFFVDLNTTKINIAHKIVDVISARKNASPYLAQGHLSHKGVGSDSP
jgi:glutamate formiminotransferase